jgi:hypothetical protein
VTVIVQLPSALYVTNQELLTVAIFALLLVRVTLVLLASLGDMFAINCNVSHCKIVALDLFKETQVTRTALTENTQASEKVSNVHVIVTSPSQVGVTSHVSLTVAMLLSLLVHTKF